MTKKLQQTAVTRPSLGSSLENTLSIVRLGPQLHISIEHAAIAQMLSLEEMDLAMCLGRAMTVKAIAKRFKLRPSGAQARISALQKKCGRRNKPAPRISLAVLGYALSGQAEQRQDVAA